MLTSLFLRHYKVIDGIKFIPVTKDYYLSSYIGDNGVGKSTVLEALDTFFNDTEWNINRQAREKGNTSDKNIPYIMPFFLIPKSTIKKKIRSPENIQLLNELSEYFWEVKSKSVFPVVATTEYKNYEQYRNDLKKQYNINDYFYISIGRRCDIENDVYFGSYQYSKNFLKIIGSKELDDREEIDGYIKKRFKFLNKIIESLYAYIYIPTEVDVSNYTKLETVDMQKLMKQDIKEQIKNTVSDDKIRQINMELGRFVDGIGKKLDDYDYINPGNQQSTIKMEDLVHKIIEIYFKNRVLSKYIGDSKIPIKNLSSGEKRKALIDLAYAFLHGNDDVDKMTILAIDEPEISLNISSCFDQFEKIKNITEFNHQVLITTHWYGYLPVIYDGYAHFTYHDEKDKVSFETLDLQRYREQILSTNRNLRGKSPFNINLKSTNDLVQSIVSTLQGDNPYRWILCEGSSEFVYFSYFFKEDIRKNRLRILPLGGCSEVKKIYSMIEVILSDEYYKVTGKVLALVDTDEQRIDLSHNTKIKGKCEFRRLLFNRNTRNINLEISSSNNVAPATEIEHTLNAGVYYNTLEYFSSEHTELKDIFKNELDPDSKVSFDAIDITRKQSDSINSFFKKHRIKYLFAKKYVENSTKCSIPDWIQDIRKILRLPNSDNKLIKLERDNELVLQK